VVATLTELTGELARGESATELVAQPTSHKPLSPQGLLFIYTHPEASKTTPDTWHHRPSPPPILSRLSRTNQPQIDPPTAKQGISLLQTHPERLDHVKGDLDEEFKETHTQ
jgi:hypothetical protein